MRELEGSHDKAESAGPVGGDPHMSAILQDLDGLRHRLSGPHFPALLQQAGRRNSCLEPVSAMAEGWVMVAVPRPSMRLRRGRGGGDGGSRQRRRCPQQCFAGRGRVDDAFREHHEGAVGCLIATVRARVATCGCSRTAGGIGKAGIRRRNT